MAAAVASGPVLTRTVPPLPNTERGTPCHISCDRSGERLLYCNGTNVIWRSTEVLAAGALSEIPEQIFVWKGHTRKVTCASMDPKGNWVASGDVTGEVRLWGAKGDHIEKNKYKLWDGSIKDVSWSGDSGRIMACGDGKDVKAVALLWDSGSRTGEVSGHIKAVNSIAFRNERPFRIATGGEDFMVGFHEGPPFKFVKSHSSHSNFVNSVRYSPNSEWFASCGSDSKLILYNGKEGDLEKEFTKPASMTGSLYSLSWSPDSKFIVTGGGDKCVRIWDVDGGKQISEICLGAHVDDMALGVCWCNPNRVVAVTTSGSIHVFNVEAGAIASIGTVYGTQGNLSAVGVASASRSIFAGGSAGIVTIHSNDQPARPINVGKGIQRIIVSTDSTAWIISLDDIVRRFALDGSMLSEVRVGEFMTGAGWLDAAETMLLCSTAKNNFCCVSEAGVAWTLPNAVERRPTALGTHPNQFVAVGVDKPDGLVGGVPSTEFVIVIFMVEECSPSGLSKVAELKEHVHEVTALKYSNDGTWLASADQAKNIVIWDTTAAEPTRMISGWAMAARVTSLSWCGDKLVSTSLDSNIAVWDVKSKRKVAQIDRAHKGGVTGAAVLGDSEFASIGADGFLNFYNI